MPFVIVDESDRDEGTEEEETAGNCAEVERNIEDTLLPPLSFVWDFSKMRRGVQLADAKEIFARLELL